MDSFLGRYRNLIVLVVVLFVQVLGLAVQVKRTTETDSSRLIRVWAVTAVTPLEKTLVWVQTSTGNLWHNYFFLRGVRAENRELKQQIEQMRIEQVRMSQDADQARRLQALLAFKEQFISQTKAAQVIGSSGSEQSRSIFIDKCDKDGIKPDMAVITADGVVGKVLHVYRSTSLVLLINDQSSGVGAILEKSRLQGILRGMPSGEVGLERVMSDEQVQPGEIILTSGGDRIFPKGLPLGRVANVSPGNDLFLNIRVKPAANLSKLEEVLVVTKIDERQATPDQAGPMRAADILAERLPTVPPKPPEPTPGAGNPAGGQGVKPGQPKSNTATPAPENGVVAKPGTQAPPIKSQPKPSVAAPVATNGGAEKPKAAASDAGGSSIPKSGAATSVKAEKPFQPPTPQSQPAAQDNPQ